MASTVLLGTGHIPELLRCPGTSSPCTSFPIAQRRGTQAADNAKEREDGKSSRQMARCKNEGNGNRSTNPAPATTSFGLHQCVAV